MRDQMMIPKEIAVLVSIVVIGIFAFYGCVSDKSSAVAGPAEGGAAAAEHTAAQPEAASKSSLKEGVPRPDVAAQSSLYEMEVKPLTTQECAQCHFWIFETIKDKGGRHRFDCVRCHVQYHAYSPRKQNYKNVMPKCSLCHLNLEGGPFHGENPRVTECPACHDPHKPKPF